MASISAARCRATSAWSAASRARRRSSRVAVRARRPGSSPVDGRADALAWHAISVAYLWHSQPHDRSPGAGRTRRRGDRSAPRRVPTSGVRREPPAGGVGAPPNRWGSSRGWGYVRAPETDHIGSRRAPVAGLGCPACSAGSRSWPCWDCSSRPGRPRGRPHRRCGRLYRRRAATGEVLAQRAPDQGLPMASTTKIMTALIVLESADLEDVMRCRRRRWSAARRGGWRPVSSCVRDLLTALLVASGNDAAITLAEAWPARRRRSSPG